MSEQEEVQVEVKEEQQPDEKQWLKERLERAKETARKELLKEIGVDDPASIKEAISLAKKLQEEKMTEQERIQAELSQLRGAAAKAEALEVVVRSNAQSAMAALTEGQRVFVEKVAGDDPAAQLRIINELKVLVPEHKSVPQPANTAPEAPAPKAAQSPQESLRQRYQELKANPYSTVEAAYMLLAHPELVTEKT